MSCRLRHLTWHDDLKGGIAAYVLLSRVFKEIDPTHEGADINVLLGELQVKHGRDIVQKYFAEVEPNAGRALDETLAPYKLKDFTKQLGIHPMPEGDHW